MSTKMEGINQPSLFAGQSLRMEVVVSRDNRYRVLAENLPWLKLGEVANRYRAKQVDLHTGRSLNLRLHLGAFIAQSMNRWTDRDTEEMVAHHAGVRILCGLEQSTKTIDHTSIETFRAQLTAEGVEEINGIVVQAASEAGFTGSGLCSSDTTVQESPIAYPTEVDHMRNIANKLVGIGKKIHKKIGVKLEGLAAEGQKIFTQIRLFTRGKKEECVEMKKKLGKKLQQVVSRMQRLVEEKVNGLGASSRGQYEASLRFYRLMLSQIRHWMRTGFHRPGKFVSLWEKDARAIVRNKAGKMVEFGRRWIITRLQSGYIIGTVCRKLGSDADIKIAPEVLEHFERVMGEKPELFVFDRGGDGRKNHKTLKENKITNGIFRKGKESLVELGRNTVLKVRRERALSEAAIATIKSSRYGFNKPRAKTSAGCVLKGQAAILGANLTRLTRDWMAAEAMT